MAGDGQTASKLLAGVFKTADIVSLPAMERNRNARQSRQRHIDIDTPFGVLVLRSGEGVFRVSAWKTA